jgi:hypothetical protein
MLAASTADMNAEFIVKRRQTAFERSNYARCNARGMPVHAHDGTERHAIGARLLREYALDIGPSSAARLVDRAAEGPNAIDTLSGFRCRE